MTPARLLVPATPTTYTLELTSRCNSTCVGCGNVFERTLGEMGVARWTHILDKVRPHIVSLRLTGGEPTLHPQFPDLIRLVDALTVPFVLFSNGLWPDPPETVELLSQCAHLDGILISLHGGDADTHRAFTGVDSFHRVVAAIREAAQAGLVVNTNTVLTRANRGQLPEIAAFSHSLGVKFTAFSRYYGPSTVVTELSDEEFRNAAATIRELHKQGMRVQLNNCVPVCFDLQPTKSCPAGITHCTIDPLGRVRPCTHAPAILGDLSSESIDVIWHSRAARKWRALIPRACLDCAEFTRCRGACKALACHLIQPQDPLIRRPLPHPLFPETSVAHVRLYSDARPEPNYVLREEAFGYLLINCNQIVPVRHEAKALLNAFDEGCTLRQLEDGFGQAGLAFVAYLFGKGLLRLIQ